MKIVLLSSGQPSLNPRLIKEADLFSDAGHDVTVVYQYWNDWGTRFDSELIPQKKWKAIRVSGSPIEDKLSYTISRVIQKFCTILAERRTYAFGIAERAIVRGYDFLKNKAISLKADIYIAHNLGALAPAVNAAKKNGSKVGFDAEDFHRYETSNDDDNSEVVIRKYLEDKYLLKLDYLSAASPLIASHYKELYPSLNPVSILNVFPKVELPTDTENHSKNLRLFWFSQTIGKDRGLEEVFNALVNAKVELHLLGALRPADKQYFDNLIREKRIDSKKIFFYSPIHPDEVIPFASQFDIGLATETGVPYNRNICLTNKIFTYIQAGLAVIASDTDAQVQLLKSFPSLGSVYKRNSGDLEVVINNYCQDKNLLQQQKEQAISAARNELNWENEGKKLLDSIESL